MKWAVLAALLLSGCAAVGSMLPGTIYSTDGHELDFQIEVTRGAGKVAAQDATTGEVFKGTYAAVMESHSAVSTTFTGNVPHFTVASSGSNIANATAFLKGDKGASLSCIMEIAAGLTPHGIGTCQDNLAKQYRLQF